MFELDRFIADCKAVSGSAAVEKAIRELMREAVADPSQVTRAMGEPTKAGIDLLYRSNEPHRDQSGVGPAYDGDAAQPPHVGGDRHVRRAGGQYFLARVAGRRALAAGGRGRIGFDAWRCLSAWQGYHPFRDQSAEQAVERDPYLWRRLRGSAARAVGRGHRCACARTTKWRRGAGSRRPTTGCLPSHSARVPATRVDAGKRSRAGVTVGRSEHERDTGRWPRAA